MDIQASRLLLQTAHLADVVSRVPHEVSLIHVAAQHHVPVNIAVKPVFVFFWVG